MELLEKLKHLEENVKLLKEIKSSVTLEDIKANKRYEWEVRYGLFESIQILIDISCKLSSNYNLGNPKSYKECVELLVQYNYLSNELSLKIIAMVGLRNLLVHEYIEIDDEKLYQFLDYLDDFIAFVGEIKDNL
ncbi:MAG TPA: DUF86 domain-containing protein [Bacteroidetes bacterium]|nr:DUF86 domain-containing protein [Bacteroidota bacterium]